MNTAIATVLLCVVMQPNLKVVDGPTRHFGDHVIKRVIQVEGEGEYDLEWQTRILRGIVQRDQARVTAPGKMEIELKLPAVRTRIDLFHDIQLKRDKRVLVGKRIATAIFPNDILSQFAATQRALPEIGLCDPAGVIAPLFEAAGLKFKLLQRDFQLEVLESKLVIVAPEQSIDMTEPTEGLRRLIEDGGTIILLARSELPGWLYSKEEPVTLSPGIFVGAEPVVGGDHPIARDLLPGDLHNWAGKGRVASNALTPSDGAHSRPLFVSSAQAERKPLVTEYWGKNGRTIVCQLDIPARLRDEPIAQVLLCNLISYARQTPVPKRAHVMRIGIPRNAITNGRFMTSLFIADPSDKQLEDLAALLLIVTPNLPRNATHISEPRTSLMDRGQIIIQSAFDDDVIQALIDLVRVAWFENLGASLKMDDQVPKFHARNIGNIATIEMDYKKQIAWGILPEDIKEGLNGIDEPRCIEVEGKVKGWRVLARPGFLVSYTRRGSNLILCSVPPRARDANPGQARVMRQIATNLGEFFLEEVR